MISSVWFGYMQMIGMNFVKKKRGTQEQGNETKHSRARKEEGSKFSAIPW